MVQMDERQSKTTLYTHTFLSVHMKLAVWSQQTSITCFYRTNPTSGFTLTSIFIHLPAGTTYWRLIPGVGSLPHCEWQSWDNGAAMTLHLTWAGLRWSSKMSLPILGKAVSVPKVLVKHFSLYKRSAQGAKHWQASISPAKNRAPELEDW